MPRDEGRTRFRIAMVAACPFPWPRGTPIRILRLAEGLHRLGHDVHVITYHLGDRSMPLPFNVHRIPNVPTYKKVTPGPTLQKLALVDPLLSLELRRFLARHPVDLIHAHHYEGLLTAYAAARSHDHTLVYDAHTLLGGELPYYHVGLPSRVKKSIGAHLDRRLPHLADHVISVSDHIKRHLGDEGGYKPQSISVIPNGVEVELFQQQNGKIHPTFSGTGRIVYAGTLAPYQGIDSLLQSFAILKSSGSDCRLRFVTDSSFEPFEKMARDLGIRDKIEIADGTFSRVPQELWNADVLVNPRIDCDGLPQKLLNYMAAGKPIVSFAGSAKTLEHEKNGLVVQDGDVEAFAAAIARLLNDPSISTMLGAGALKAARAQSWDNVARKVEQVYRDVLRRRVRL